MYCIYKATNKINSKAYIGKTNNFQKRQKEHFSDDRGNHIFHKAIKKYGKENFCWEIIEDNIPTNEKASEREVFWISFYETFFKEHPDKGYNMTKGGDGGACYNIRKVASYSKEGKLEKVFDSLEEARKYYNISGTTSISRACKSSSYTCKGKKFLYVENNPPQEIPIQEQKNVHCKKILQFDKQGNFIKAFDSIKEAEAKGFSRTSIIGCAKGYYKTAGGYVWRYEGDADKAKSSVPLRAYRDIKVMQFDTNGNFINSFFSCADASRKNGIKNYKAIHKALTTKSHFSNGYLWYKSNDVNIPIPR